MLSRDFWRTGRWHGVASEFRIVSGPSVNSQGQTFANIDWTMSEVCSGQVEWGTTAGVYPNATTLQAISGGFSSHHQTISPLQPATTYHFRTVSTSAAGVTVYSSDQIVTSDGAPLPEGAAGPRYGKSTWPGRTTTAWPALPGTYVLVPASVLSASDQAAALATFLNDKAQVPDGDVENPTYVVFDRTLLGAGTTYTITHSVLMGQSGVLRSNVIFWAYNTTFRMVSPPTLTGSKDLPLVIWRYGGMANVQWLGGEYHGPNTDAFTYTTRSVGDEDGHGIVIWSSWQNIKIMDTYVHNVCGDGIGIAQYTPTQDASHGLMFGTQGAPADLEMAYNLVRGCARQGIVLDQGTRVQVHHNIVEYIAIYPFDAEDELSPFNVHIDTEITDNVFRYWSVHFDMTQTQASWNTGAISFNRESSSVFGAITNLTISRNRFEGGAVEFGNPVREQYWISQGWNQNPAPTFGYGPLIKWNYPSYRATNVIITDNIADMPADQDKNRTGSTLSRNGNAVIWGTTDGLTITDNDFGNMGVHYRQCTAVTVANVNGIVDGP